MAYSSTLNRFTARLLASLIALTCQFSPHSQASSTPTTVNLNPAADTSLFELSPDSNMGSMSHIASGTIRTGQKSRALYSFNLSSIPSNATITSASLSIPVVIVPPGAPPATFGLHRMLQSWTEGNKSGNRGSTASTGEPTWNSRAKGSTSWGAPGGSAGSDFSASPAASVSVNGLGTYTFNSTDSLVADAQAWLANPSSNFGWMLLCQSEGVTKSARRFAARENATPPILRITYTTPAVQTQPQIQWSAPASITYGTQLSTAQLNATASTPGSFVYSPTAGTQLDAGTHTLSVTFTPTDAANFSTASASTSIIVTKASPTLSWSAPATITYGTQLTAAQLNATASTPGSFVYSPAAGTQLDVGTHTLSVTFTPTDTANFSSASASTSIFVTKASPTLSWPAPVSITYGTQLSAAQLNATANTPGTFVYSPTDGTQLDVGTHTLSVTFTPTDTANFSAASASTSIIVTKASPTLSWPAPATITYGTQLSAAQLNATANTPGSFVYSPATGTQLDVGTRVLSVTFTPTDTANFSTASASTSIIVTKASPTLSWPTPATITYGAQLTAAQLNATANTPGSFVYSPAAGTQLDAGTHTLSVTFTPTDTANFSTASASVPFQIEPASLTLAVANLTRFGDEPNPTLTGIITGIAAGDDLRAVYATSATTLSPPGSYPITAQWADPQNRLSNYRVTIQEGTLLILDSVTTLKGIGFDGYVADATVFLDLNNNQKLDTDEPSTITDLTGKFSLPVSATRVDANRNGRIDGTEGSLVLVGGTDRSTGLPLTTPLLAPANSGVISPVTTLLTALLKAKPETTETTAQDLLRTALSIDPSLRLLDYDPFAAASTNDSKAIAFLKANAQVQTLIVNGSALLMTNPVQTTASAALALNTVLALRLANGTTNTFTDSKVITELINDGAKSLNLTLPPQIAATAAGVIGELNRTIDSLNSPTNSPSALASEVSRVQILANGRTPSDLNNLAQGRVQPIDLQTAYTSEAIRTTLNAIQLPESGPQRPSLSIRQSSPIGSFDIRLQNTRLGITYRLESSTDLISWTVLRTLVATASSEAVIIPNNPPLPSTFFRVVIP